ERQLHHDKELESESSTELTFEKRDDSNTYFYTRAIGEEQKGTRLRRVDPLRCGNICSKPDAMQNSNVSSLDSSYYIDLRGIKEPEIKARKKLEFSKSFFRISNHKGIRVCKFFR
ncbi:hypothetical protein C2G38_2046046, partial [Gigaspora rosea]